MSALSYYLEDEGVPTVAMSLIRPHSEKVANPRSLWVPFELGRPLGPPKDAKFQITVIETALRLLEAEPGPVVLRDFDKDDPTSADLDGWKPLFELPKTELRLTDHPMLDAALTRELAVVLPWYQRFVTEAGRTTVGNSGLGIEACAVHLAKSLADGPSKSPIAEFSEAQYLRFVLDDLKAFYLEAASVGTRIPSSRQTQMWFWDQTVAAQMMIALRVAMMASDDKRNQAVGRMNVVPGAQVARLKLG